MPAAATGCPIGPDPGTADRRRPGAAARGAPTVVGVWPGPRVDWFAPDALDAALTATTWTVSATSAASASASTGRRCARRVDDELPSEGLLHGAVQVPPDGRPVVMLADHPTTGGYPVLAVVDPARPAVVAQARPGTALRFRRPTVTAGGHDDHWGYTT